jgi:hypothetical protein
MTQRISQKLFAYKHFILFLMLAIMTAALAACSPQQELDQVVASAFQTQVALGVKAAHMTQTALAEQIQQTTTVEEALTPSPTNTVIPTETELPTLTATLPPSLTPTETPTPTPTNANAGVIPENAIVYYLTLVDTGGTIGCGDSLIKLSTGQYRSGDLAADLKVGLDTIFKVGQYSGGTFNATFPSKLWVDDVKITQEGTAVVNFSGSYVKPESSCDASRYRSQVWATALQFEEIKRFEPHVGNSLLGDRLAVYSDGNN